jgi:hypothetical protein
MQEFLEKNLDINDQKMLALEDELFKQKELLLHTIDSLKETQRYLVKLAHNQAEVTRRVSQWPYIAVQDRDYE